MKIKNYGDELRLICEEGDFDEIGELNQFVNVNSGGRKAFEAEVLVMKSEGHRFEVSIHVRKVLD